MTKDHLAWLRNHLKNTYQTDILENFLDLRVIEIEQGAVTLIIGMGDNNKR